LILKVLHVNKFYSPEIGGVETVCKQYSDYIAKSNKITVLCVSKNFSLFTKKEYIDDILVYRCSSFGTFFSMPISISFIFYYLFLCMKNDVVLSHLPFPLFDLSNWIAKCLKIPYRLNTVWHSDIVKQKKLLKILSPILHYTLKSCDKVIVTSPNMIKYSSFLTKYSDKCEIIPLCLNSEEVNLHLSTIQASDEKEFDGFFFGRLTYYKGAAFLIDSLASAKKLGFEFKVLIAGVGDDEEYIKQVIKDNSLFNVTFINKFLSEQEKYYYLSKSKCFLFPSTTHSEAFGITQLEAMFSGVPVINTELRSGVPWVSQHMETGLTIRPEDQVELIDALKLIISDESLRMKLSVNCRQVALERFDEKIIKKRIVELVERLNC